MALAIAELRFNLRRLAAPALAGAVLLCTEPSQAATLLLCRAFDLSMPIMAALTIPAGSLFRDDGRADDPLVAFNGEKLQIRLETVDEVVIPPISECATAQVRVTSDSLVRAVASGDNRNFVYAGSSLFLDAPEVSEDLLTVKARVLDHVP